MSRFVDEALPMIGAEDCQVVYTFTRKNNGDDRIGPLIEDALIELREAELRESPVPGFRLGVISDFTASNGVAIKIRTPPRE